MPGSLLLNNNNDAWSDVSSRSLDSKLGGKRVSFNKAVRVKQYPWKPNTSTQMKDHLTLPSNRFWFKVYQNKEDSNGDKWERNNTWEQENMECVHDSLAPIAEDEDQDNEESYSITKPHHSLHSREDKNFRKDYGNHNHHPTEPPIDYLDTIPSVKERSRAFNSDKSNVEKNGKHTYNNLNISNSTSPERKYGMTTDGFGILSSINEDHVLRNSTNKNSGNLMERKWNISNDRGKGRERRSRSHDDYLSNGNNFNDFNKADKSVSTEDLNYGDFENDSISRDLFVRRRRDMATQCYGTLSKGKGKEAGSALSMFKRFNFPDEGSNNLLKTTRSSFHGRRTRETFNTAKCETSENNLINRAFENNESKLSSRNTSTSLSGRYSTANTRKSEPSNRSFSSSYKSSPTRKNDEATQDYAIKSPATKPKSYVKDSQTDGLRSLETIRFLNNRTSNTVGYVRGRQIPLAEVNSNKKLPNRNENNKNHYLSSPSRSRKDAVSDYKSESSLSGSKKSFFSKTDGPKEKTRNITSSAKSSSGYNDSQSMIDWSLSGFHLAARTENGTTSISDSECTVHRRPPLLMYIPGISHHDRPAEEDDRLSALSDMSRTELNDELNGLDSRSDIKRRYSMPRDNKLKWIKWKNNSKR